MWPFIKERPRHVLICATRSGRKNAPGRCGDGGKLGSAGELASLGAAQAEAEGGHPVAAQAEGAQVREVAFAAALDDGDDVVGLPERATGVALQIPEVEQALPRFAAGSLQNAVGGEGINAAALADAAVALEDLLAEVAGV